MKEPTNLSPRIPSGFEEESQIEHKNILATNLVFKTKGPYRVTGFKISHCEKIWGGLE